MQMQNHFLADPFPPPSPFFLSCRYTALPVADVGVRVCMSQCALAKRPLLRHIWDSENMNVDLKQARIAVT